MNRPLPKQMQRRPQLPAGFYIACPHCTEELRIPGEFLGVRTQCKRCHGQFDCQLTNPELTVVAVYTHCPHCADELRAASAFLGRAVACKQCDKPFRLSTIGLSSTSAVDESGTDRIVTVESQGPTEIHDLSELDFAFVDGSTSGGDDGVRSLDESTIRNAEAEGWFDEPTEDWYGEILGQTMGPMSLTELRELARTRQLTGDDRVRCGSSGVWQPAMTVASLLADLHMTVAHSPNEAVDDSAGLTERQADETDFKFEGGFEEDESRSEEAINAVDARPSDTDFETDSLLKSVELNSLVVPEPSETDFELVEGLGQDSDTFPNDSPDTPKSQSPKGKTKKRKTLPRPERDALSDVLVESEQERAQASKPTLSPTSEPLTQPTVSLVETVEMTVVDSVEVPAMEESRPESVTATAADRKPFFLTLALSILAGAIVVAVISFVKSHNRVGTTPTIEHYRSLQSMAAEFRLLRIRHASSAEWQQLTKRLEAQLEPIVDDLSNSSGSKIPARQSLLWAAQDHLPAMLHDARKRVSQNEKAFNRHLRDARSFMAGRHPDAR